MRILLTGASGFIGSHLVPNLLESGYEVTVLLRAESNFNHPGVEILRFQKYSDILILLKDAKVDGVIHLATNYVKDHKPVDISPLIESNITFPAMVLESLRTSKVKWWINTCSSWEFNKDLEVLPHTLYASTKSAFLRILLFFKSQQNFKSTSLVLGDSFGPGDPRKKIFNFWKESLRTNFQLPMSGGEQKLNLIYIDDIITGYLKLIKYVSDNSDVQEFYTVRYPEIKSLKELAATTERIVGKKLNIEWGKLPYRENEVFEPASNFSLVPGWSSKVGLEEGIRRFFNED